MKAFERTAVQDLSLLCFIAGSADAAGYLGLGHIFTSNQTGNAVLLGMALGQGQFAEAGCILNVLLVFMVGVAVGAWLGRRIEAQDWPQLARRIISAEAALLLLFGTIWCWLSSANRLDLASVLIVPLALAMGLQAAAMNRLSMPGIVTTAITGTLTSFTSGLLAILTMPRTSPAAPSGQRIAFHALVIGLYGGGAIVSGVVMLHLPWAIGLIPAALCLFIVLRHSCK